LHAGDAAESHALSAAGRSEYAHYAVFGLKLHGGPGAAQILFYIDVEAHRAPPPFCFLSSRLTDSSTTAEMARLMSTHIMALRWSLVRQYWYAEVAMVAVRLGV